MRIDIKDHALAKAEEVAIVEKLHDFFKGSDTYLASLFTKEFLGWVSKQIKNDFPPDLYHWGFGSTGTRAEIEELKSQWSLCQSLNLELLSQNESLAENLKIKADMVDRIQERMSQLFEDKVDLEMIIAKKVDAIDALELETTALKAKLYDLMNKGGKK